MGRRGVAADPVPAPVLGSVQVFAFGSPMSPALGVTMARTIAWVVAGITVATVAALLLGHVSAILRAKGWGA